MKKQKDRNGGDKERMYTIIELAKIMNITRQGVLKYINNGLINAAKDEQGFYKITEEEVKRIKEEWFLNEPHYNVAEAAELLNIGETSLRNYISGGEISHKELPTGQKVISQEEIERVLKIQKYSPKYMRLKGNKLFVKKENAKNE